MPMIIKQPKYCNNCGRMISDFSYSKWMCKRCGKEFQLCAECIKTTTCDYCGGSDFEPESDFFMGGEPVMF